MPIYYLKILLKFFIIFYTILIPSQCFSAEIEVLDQKIQDRTIVLIMGQVKKGDDAKFLQITSSLEDAIVTFDGVTTPESKEDVQASMEVGSLIYFKKFDTAIVYAHNCSSVCSLMWLAGNKRLISTKAYLSLGNYIRDNSSPEKLSDMYATIGYYLANIGMKLDFIKLSTSWIGSNVFLKFTIQNMLRSGILSQTLDETWVENATYPKGPLPPPPISFESKN
ncbi:hypothetical protein [Novosphingobium sp.]|uniref:hypothetical protein n=1 Tax=Novosphingobium sp. TaxID=1874826 RepID=UPI002625E601|nr:hypothetical protein [Novosphingobium sp.]